MPGDEGLSCFALCCFDETPTRNQWEGEGLLPHTTPRSQYITKESLGRNLRQALGGRN